MSTSLIVNVTEQEFQKANLKWWEDRADSLADEAKTLEDKLKTVEAELDGYRSVYG